MHNFEESRKDSNRGIRLPRVRVRESKKKSLGRIFTIDIIIFNDEYIDMILLVSRIHFNERSV